VGLASEPNFLLLDEPTAGMSGQETRQAIDLIARITEERKLTLFFTEHDMEVVFTHADRVIVLAAGELIAEGPPQAVRADARVREVYLGAADD
jgi:branched-chain amino acid transport system ATP-binding protein